MSSIKITYFVHGTTTDNERGIATGWLSGVLSERGREQAVRLGEQAKHRYFDAVFCSDLKRAVESAELGFGAKWPIVQDKRLRECNYGDMNGSLATSFKDRMMDYIDTPFPNGESYEDVERRLADFIQFLREQYDGRSVAIVAHQAPQLALDVLLKNRNWQQAIDEDWRKRGVWQAGWDYRIGG